MKRNLLFGLLVLVSATMLAQTRVTIFGDSYSTFEGYLTPATNESWYYTENNPRRDKNNDVTKVEQTWWWQVIERMNWKLEMNNSYSGSTVGYFGYQNENYQPRSFNTRVENLGEPDVILSCCITNDSWTGEKLGNYKYANWTENDMWYFRPAMARLLSTMKQNYPMAKIYIIQNTQLKPEFCESLQIICKHYGVPVIILKDIDKQDGHPSIKGHKDMAEQVVNYIKNEK